MFRKTKVKTPSHWPASSLKQTFRFGWVIVKGINYYGSKIGIKDVRKYCRVKMSSFKFLQNKNAMKVRKIILTWRFTKLREKST